MMFRVTRWLAGVGVAALGAAALPISAGAVAASPIDTDGPTAAVGEEPGVTGVLLSQWGPTPGVPEQGDNFGWAAVGGDFNGDLVTDLAVAAFGESIDSATSAGAVNIFYASTDATATAPQFISQYGPVPGRAEGSDRFGFALATGDVNGDGFDDLAVSSPFETLPADPTNYVGMVQVIFGSSGGLVPATAISLHFHTGVGAPESDNFGYALAMDDFNGDGFADLAASTEHPSTGGAVKIYWGSTEGVVAGQFDVIYSSDLGADMSNGFFGERLTTGDFNNDTFADLAVFHIDATQRIAMIPGSGSGLRIDGHHWIDEPTGANWFPDRLAAGDTNGDGWDELVVADRSWTSSAGRVLIFEYALSGAPSVSQLSQDAGVRSMLPEPNDQYGGAIHVADLDGDLIDDLAIGVPGEEVFGPNNVGIVHLVWGSLDGLDPKQQPFYYQGRPGLPGRAELDDGFGSALASADLAGTGVQSLFVGAPSEDWGDIEGAGAGVLLTFPSNAAPVDLTSGSCANLQFVVSYPETMVPEVGYQFDGSFTACRTFYRREGVSSRFLHVVDNTEVVQTFTQILDGVWPLTVGELTGADGFDNWSAEDWLESDIRSLTEDQTFTLDRSAPLGPQIPQQFAFSDTTDAQTGRRIVSLQGNGFNAYLSQMLDISHHWIEVDNRVFSVAANNVSGNFADYATAAETMASTITGV